MMMASLWCVYILREEEGELTYWEEAYIQKEKHFISLSVKPAFLSFFQYEARISAFLTTKTPEYVKLTIKLK